MDLLVHLALQDLVVYLENPENPDDPELSV